MTTGGTTRSIKIFINGKEVEDNIKSIRAAYAKTSAELNKLERGSEAYNKKISELRQLGGILDEHTAKLKRMGQASSFMDHFGSALGVMSGAQLMTSAISKLGNEFNTGVEDMKTYSANLAEMADVMDISGDQLVEFKGRAQSLTDVALSGGESIQTAAGDILEAFKLIAGANPEILETEGGLEAVTRSALILSRASGEDLSSSVNTLTTVMGQFSAGAEEANRIINALAAGGKAGAAETNDVAESMKGFGLVAASFNVTIEESVGLIETLGDKQIKGAEAGTKLRNILLNMASASNLPAAALAGLERYGVNLDIVSDKTLPLSTRLKELSKVQNDVTVLAQVFDKANIDGAQALLQNVDKYEKFTTAVTDTDAAMQSASIRSASFAVKMEDLKVTWNNIRNVAVKFLVEAGLPMLTWGINAIKTLGALPAFIRENKVELGLLAVALITFNAQAIAASVNSLRLAAAEKARAIATTAVAVAQRLLNAAMNANPIALIISALALLGAGLVAVYKHSQPVRNALSGIKSVAVEIFTILKEVIGSFASGFQKLRDGDISGALGDFGKALVKSNPVGLALTEGKRLGAAYRKGVQEQMTWDHAGPKTGRGGGNNAQYVNTPPTASADTTEDVAAAASVDAAAKAAAAKAAAARAKAAEKEKADREKARKDLEDHLTKLRELTAKHQSDIDKDAADSTARGLMTIREKYGKEIAEATALEAKGSKEATDIRINLERLQATEIATYRAQARKKLADQLTESQKSEDQIIRAGYQERFSMITELENSGLLTRQEAADKTAALQQQLNLDLLAGLQKRLMDEQAIKNAAKVAEVQAQAKYDADQLQLTGNTHQILLASVTKQYDDLIVLAEKAGVDQIEIDRLNGVKRNALAVAQLNEVTRSLAGMGDAFGQLGSAIGQMIDQSGKKMEGWLKFQRALTLAQIAFDTASAISGIITKAVSTSITWYDAIIGIASGVAVVISNIARATALLNTPIPTYQQHRHGGYTDVMGADDGRRYRARQLGAVGTGMLPGEPVTLLASEDGAEYIVSNPDLRNPLIASLVAQIDGISRGRGGGIVGAASGGYSTGGAAATQQGDSSLLLQTMMAVLADSTRTNKALLTQIQAGLPVVVDNVTTVDIFDRFRRLNNSAGGTLG